MKKTHLVDLFRFVKKTLVSFLSVGIFMGVSFAVFMGIFSAAQSLRDATDKSFKDCRFADIELTSSAGFSAADVDSLKRLGCVEQAEGGRETYAWGEFGGGRYVTRLMDNTKQLDQSELVAGRLPVRTDECAIDYSLNYHDGLALGTYIDIKPFEGYPTGLSVTRLKITGFVTHPYALSKDKENRRGFAPFGDGSVYSYVLVSSGAFRNLPGQSSFQTIKIRVQGSDQYSTFHKDYKKRINSAKKAIEAWEGKRTDITTADRYTNTSFLEIDSFATSLFNISWSFSIIFVIVSILIVFTMLSRLIDEQRIYTGIKKSIGFKTGEIMAFFLLYSGLGSLVGILIGMPLSSYIENLAYSSYAGRFWFEASTKLSFQPVWAAQVYGTLTIIAILATALAVGASAMEKPTTLLLGEKPPRDTAKVIKRFVPGWNKLDTFSKMILCNIFSNPKRLLSVVCGIAGSLALLLIGMLMHSSIVSVPAAQAKITRYSQLIVCDDDRSVKQLLKNASGVKYLNVEELNCAFQYSGLLGAATLSCLPEGYEDYLKLRSVSGKTMQLPGEGALISAKIADLNSLSNGSKLRLLCSGREITVKVAGVFQNYAYNAVVLSPGYYRQVFGTAPRLNQFYVSFKNTSAEKKDELLAKVKAANGFLALRSANRFDGYFEDMAHNLMAVLMILILLAAFLIAVVIYNTVVMNIVRRKSELAMLLINGFSTRDIRRYISREFWSMALVSIVLGTGLGCVLSVQVEKIVEPIYCQFVHAPDPKACWEAVGLALAMALVLNTVAMRMLRKIKITDAMQ